MCSSYVSGLDTTLCHKKEKKDKTFNVKTSNV